MSVESRTSSSREEDQAFERKAFVDGVTYLLRGLPQDLDEYEITQLRNALPNQVVSQYAHSSHQLALPGKTVPAQPRSVLYRVVQLAVIQIVLLFCFVLPYLMQAVKVVVRTERKHRVSEKMLGQGVDLAKTMGRQGASMIETMYGMADGRMGRSVTTIIGWTVDSVAQGIRDGVQEGLRVQADTVP